MVAEPFSSVPVCSLPSNNSGASKVEVKTDFSIKIKEAEIDGVIEVPKKQLDLKIRSTYQLLV
jgi:hypothetical protein